ncbi:MAG TPA: rhodanese-like domain-containing protein [Saprospiraceae bacterium]|nr:rhodanese-like domain-containing protein [Saprospiraceae bacterium]
MKAIQIFYPIILMFFISSCQKQQNSATTNEQKNAEQVEKKPANRDALIRNISMMHLKNRIDYYDDSYVLLDVRTLEEFEEGAIPGAKLFDVNQTDKFKEAVATFNKDNTYFVYCRSGQRSKEAFHIMNDMGFEKVYNVTGGYLKWEELKSEE